MGRKKLTPAELVPDTPLNVQKLNEDRNTMANLEAAFSDEERQTTLLIGARIGRRSMAMMISKLVTVADVLDLQRIKESKQYKGFVHVDGLGKKQTISTWDEYCELVEGKSRQSIDLEIMNLNQLGEELFDAMRQVGIGPGKMREIRKLPEDSQAALLEAARGGDKDTLLDLAEELIARHSKEKEELASQKLEAESELEAARTVCRGVRAENDRLEVEMAKLKHRHQKLSPSDRARELRRSVADNGLVLETSLLGALRTACLALQTDTEESGIDHAYFVGGIVNNLEMVLQGIRDEFRLPASGDLGWIKETTFQEILEGNQEGAAHD